MKKKEELKKKKRMIFKKFVNWIINNCLIHKNI